MGKCPEGCVCGRHTEAFKAGARDRASGREQSEITKARKRASRLARTPVPSYVGVHHRLAAQRGKAKEHVCTCGTPAAQWAYVGGCPTEVVCPRRNKPYTPDLTRYVPLCLSCHRKMEWHRRQREAANK